MSPGNIDMEIDALVDTIIEHAQKLRLLQVFNNGGFPISRLVKRAFDAKLR